MTEQQLKELYLEVDGKSYPPRHKYDDMILKKQTKEYEYIGLKIIKSAEEVYQECLSNKNKPVEPPIDKTEVLLNELSEALLESELRAVKSEVVINETSNYVLDLDERLTNIELKK